MASSSVSDLHTFLQQSCGRIRKSKNSTLFREGEKAFGVFVVFSGTVRLDFGVDCPLSRSYGAGALLGLPATITKRKYSMTATVTDDAEVGLWTPGALNSLLLEHPELCQQPLVLLCERMAENNEIMKACARQTSRNPFAFESRVTLGALMEEKPRWTALCVVYR